MNGNLEMLVHEFQADRERELERRALFNQLGERTVSVRSRDRVLAWTGRTLVRWGRRLQAVGHESHAGADATWLPAMK